jgi:hypothetical protein
MEVERGRLLILEPLVETDDQSPRSLMDALLQAVICETGTRARSETQLRALATDAGLHVDNVELLPTGHGVVVCRLRA